MAALALGCAAGELRHSGASGTSDPTESGAAVDSGLEVDSGAAGDSDETSWPELARVDLPEGLLGADYGLSDGREIYGLAQAFYAEHPDDYEFLFLFTDFAIPGIFAFSVPLDHSIEGIGLDEVMELYGWGHLSPATAGSAGRLQHVVLMNHPDTWAPGATWDMEDVLVHEAGHRWSANLSVDGGDPWVLTDEWWSHWAVVANVGGPSAMGYGEPVDQGDGSFRFELMDELVFSDLELYQQGLLGAEEVGELFYVEGAPESVVDSVANATTFSGARVDLHMEDIIARHGPRIPDASAAQRSFRAAFAVVCAQECDPAVMEAVEALRASWPDRWELATRGLGQMSSTR